MFLKRLDIVGFKSFADKTSIEFSSGITAVVGPNGSGKSNISDAIRWVLGEQSARSLRGSKMEDVIFAGSETRRSINYCEVSLTLDNTDSYLPVIYEEVTVTRRVYRSGESEYSINKQPCRLKDITELFMDSGLGRESYSIIGQGRIEEMLSTKPEDRRGPFEDAAGIVKFKFRKREAERKLDETAANILRVDDILSELESQAGPLETEAKRAQEYKTLHDELTTLEIHLLVHDIEQLQQRWQEAKQNVDDWDARRQAQLEMQGVLDEQAAKSRQALESQARALESLQQQLLESTQERQRFQGQVELLRERSSHATDSLAERTKQQDALAAEALELRERVQGEQQRLQELTAKLELKSADLEVAVHQVNPEGRAVLEAEIDSLNNELIELHHNAATTRNEVKQAAESQQDDLRRRQRMDQDLLQRQSTLEEIRREITELSREHTDLTSEINTIVSRLNEARVEAQEVVRQESDVAKMISQRESEVAALTSRRELLLDLEAGYDGYAQGVRFVLGAADKHRLDGIRGSVAALIQVSPSYETAIETALGGALQNIVCDNEASARAAITLLKQRQAGRATFMPLDVIRGRSLGSNERNLASRQTGFVGIASDLVQTDTSYRQVVEHLLGNVVVADNLKSANAIARVLNYRVRIVTPEGDTVNPGGTMSGGGQSRKGPGLLGRSRELRQVEEHLVERTADLKQQKVRQEKLRQELLRLQAQQRGFEEGIRRETAKSQEVQGKLREGKAREQHAVELYQTLLWEQEQLDSGSVQWTTRLESLNQSLAETEAALQRVENELRQRRADLEQRDKDVATFQEHMTGLRVEVATLRQERDTLKDRLAELRQREGRLQTRIRELDVEKLGQERIIQDTEQEIEQLTSQTQRIHESVQSIEADIVQQRQERLQLEVELESANARLRQQQQTVHDLEEQLHKSQVQVERVDVELNHALERMGEQYKMTYEWAKGHYELQQDVNVVSNRAQQLRRNLEQLGEVQLGAIEDWARLSERITFLVSERDDLETARTQLRDLISEMDVEMSKRFAATFEQIREQFQIVFRHLFNGGRADLQLTNADDLLTTGIEVNVQPPGKKLQNMNLMSGGERALVAMALLFAILRVKPVPFCVLDEVEAALDEANVTRFAQYLRKFSDDSQFITITHRRGTMEEADVLYGVTMQESGVSSLIGVKLSDVDTNSESA